MEKIFDYKFLGELTNLARTSKRHRQHQNVHQNHDEVCQRLFNAIEPNSYIRPHRHSTDSRSELLIAVRGEMALVIFTDQGAVSNVIRFGTEKHGGKMAVGVEVAANSWHTVVAVVPGSILLEVKAGPFDPMRAKDLADWAPEESSIEGGSYLEKILAIVQNYELCDC